jgi:hypothetical protein
MFIALICCTFHATAAFKQNQDKPFNIWNDCPNYDPFFDTQNAADLDGLAGKLETGFRG